MTNSMNRLIIDKPQEGNLNMAVDAALLQACEQGAGGLTLRLYSWDRPTLSVGYGQKAEQSLDLDRCRHDGLPVVRRPTGGRALLHDQELTYSVVAPLDHPLLGGRLKDTLFTISQLLCMGLNRLGITGLQTAVHRPGPASAGRSPACFLAVNHGEITVEGKKLVGSAQRRLKRAFLQHGSVLLKPGSERLSFYIQNGTSPDHAVEEKRLLNAMMTLDQACGRTIEWEEAAQAVASGFQSGVAGSWQTGELSETEVRLREKALR